MLLQCEFQYDITQTVRLTNGSQCAEGTMQSPPTAKRCPVNLSQVHSPGPFYQIATAEVASCDDGPQDCASPRPLRVVQCHCYSRVMS